MCSASLHGVQTEMEKRLCIHCGYTLGICGGCKACLEVKVKRLRACQKQRELLREDIRRGIVVGFAPHKTASGPLPRVVAQHIAEYVYIKAPLSTTSARRDMAALKIQRTYRYMKQISPERLSNPMVSFIL